MKLKNKILIQLILVSIAVLTTAVFAFAEIGFQAKLKTPPLFISGYDAVEDEVSVAIYPKSYPFLSSWLAFRPNPKYSNFAENSIRFETQYYGLLREKYYLVPVSVDAEKYSNYRIRKALAEQLSENFTGTLINQQENKTRRSGLGVQVALPKRLQKIFGEGSAGLKISGKRRISFAGRSSWTDETTSGVPQSKFPSLVMDQVSRFSITGTIGTKITVSVSQDSQTDIPLANRIQIRYRGDDDDVLKSIEAGNTTLSIPNTQFVGYSSQVRGLFGLKTEAQVGNLTLTAIASQEKGSSETTSITAGGEEDVEFIRDYEYVERQIFDLLLQSDEQLQAGDKISELLMYESVPSYNAETDNIFANFYADPIDTTKFTSEALQGNSTNIREIPRERYNYFINKETNVPYVIFTTPQSRSVDIGYYMEVSKAAGGNTIYGNISDSVTTIDTVTNIPKTVYKLKLLARKDIEYKKDHATWDLMWRNCYAIPKNTIPEDVKFRIFKGLEGTERRDNSAEAIQGTGVTSADYLEIMGLDLQIASSGNAGPDGVVDKKSAIFRSDLGLVIFPSRTPFDTDTTFTHTRELPPLDEDDRIPLLYKYDSWEDKSKASKFYIQKVTTTRGSVIRLNRANIIEGSERITADGKQLQKGTDYNIQYDFGQVTLISETATDPNAEIKIDFEYAPFFAVQKKSLLGVRAEYEWSKDLQFGSTFLYKSDKAQERKPKVGQETARTIVFDTDISLKLHPNFLTSMIDALPFIDTDKESNMTVTAEIAQSHPNPNINDVAYVDDFETALDNVGLGTFRTAWKKASVPMQIDNQNYLRSTFLWHRPIEKTAIQDIYNRDTEVGTGTTNTFRMIFRPKEFLKTEDTVNVVPENTRTWGGITRAFGSPLSANKVKLFEVRLKGRTGIIHFDFGTISEDLNGNDAADTEDKNNNNFIDTLTDGSKEDTGLDGLMDEFEGDSVYNVYDPETNRDPHGDNWYSFDLQKGKCPFPDNRCVEIAENFNPYTYDRYYDFLNGTEGNEEDGASSKRPDKESLSSGFTSSGQNSYFAFELNLNDGSADSFLVEGSERVPFEDNPDNDDPSDTIPWVTYRIPITEAKYSEIYSADPTATPNWSQISHVRVWMEGEENKTIADADTVEIADWYFVQPNWKENVIFSPLSDMRSEFVVSSVSDDVDENFTVPPDVEAYVDPATNVVEVQKALQLKFDNLNHYDTCIAVKELLSIDQYSGYRRLEMYVHGDEDVTNADDMENTKFFFRLGENEENYYEYRTDIKPGWDDGNHVNIDFNELTALKDSALKELETGQTLNVENEKYRILGRPNISQIKFLAVGVVNEDINDPISGTIWVDELRVTHVRKDVGTAGRISVGGNMGDFITYNFALKSTDPYFRGLSTATRGGSNNNLGAGQHTTNWNSSVTLRLDKFLPRSWNASIPLNLSYSKLVRTPLLRNNSDIILPEEVRLEEQTVSTTKGLSFSTRFSKKTSNPLFTVLLNRINPKISYRETRSKDVRTPYRYGEVLGVSSDYNLNRKEIPKVPIFFFLKPIPILKKASESKLALYPKNWTMQGNFSRNLSITDDITGKRTPNLKRDFTGSMKIDYNMFDNLSTSFNYSTRRDLSNLDNVNFSLNNKEFKLGLEQQYSQRFSMSYDPHLISFFTTAFSFKSSYQDVLVESDVLTLRSSMTRSMSLSGKFDHKDLLGGGSSGNQRRNFRSERRSSRKKNVIEQENAKGKKFYDPVLSGLRKITGWINPIAYSYSKNFNNTAPGLISRPAYKYLFGFADDPNIDTFDEGIFVQNSGEGESYDFSSGFTLLGGITTNVKYRKSISRDIVNGGRSNLGENSTTNWPDLSIRIQKFKHLPFIQSYVNKFINIFSPRTGYSRSIKESIDITDPNNTFTISKTINVGYSPLLQINFKLFRSLSLTSSITKSQVTSEKFNRITQDQEPTSVSSKNSFALSAKYSFSSPHGISIPIFGKLKFNSTVDFSMNVKFNSSKIENFDKNGEFINETSNESSKSYNPVISYSFSRQIKGGITMRWQDQKGKVNTRHTREVQLWTEITF